MDSLPEENAKPIFISVKLKSGLIVQWIEQIRPKDKI